MLDYDGDKAFALKIASKDRVGVLGALSRIGVQNLIPVSVA